MSQGAASQPTAPPLHSPHSIQGSIPSFGKPSCFNPTRVPKAAYTYPVVAIFRLSCDFSFCLSVPRLDCEFHEAGTAIGLPKV